MPHIAEEMWSRLGYRTLLADTPWPSVDHKLVLEEKVKIGVQVMGKLRGTIELARDSEEKVIKEAALQLVNVKRSIGDRPIRKIIVVPNRIVNVVI